MNILAHLEVKCVRTGGAPGSSNHGFLHRLINVSEYLRPIQASSSAQTPFAIATTTTGRG